MKILGDNVECESKFLVFKKRRYEDKDGNGKDWNMVSRVNDTKAVIVVAFKEATMTEGRKLVINKEFRVPIGDEEWGFPAGLIEKGEDPVDAARRELKEETGLDIKRVLLVSPYVNSSAGMTDEEVRFVFVEVDGDETNLSKAGQEGSEEITTYMMTMDGVNNLIEYEYTFDAKAWLIMKRFADTGEII